MSRGEFDSVLDALSREKGSREVALDALIDSKSKDYAAIAYLADDEKADKLFDCQTLLRLPVCRNGKLAATVGLSEKVWEGWR